VRRRTAIGAKRAVDEKVAHDTPAADDPERGLLERERRESLHRAIAALDDESAEAIACMLDGARPGPGIGASAFRKRVSRA
jgi:DNA-directed RNA polymerase specialized sigma24 family protein